MELNNIINAQDIEIIIRLTIAIILGFIIGIEREITSKSAGLRTHILVCLGSCAFTILSIYAFPKLVQTTNGFGFSDPARVAAQILTGIGFIGGGTVLRMGPSVIGLTTAASLWVAAAIGMASGTGDFLIGTYTAVSTVVILTGIRTFERIVLGRSKKKYAKIKVALHCNMDDVNKVIDMTKKKFNKIQEISQKESEKLEDFMRVTFVLNIYEMDPTMHVYNKFIKLKNIHNLSIREMYD